MPVLLSLLLWWLALTPAAWATEYYVDREQRGGRCSDGQPGTAAQPRCTVLAGLGLLAPGDTLILRGGTYEENLEDVMPSGTSEDARITLRGAPGEEVILLTPPGGSGVSLRGDFHYITFQDLIFDGNQRQGSVGFATSSGAFQAHHIRYVHCEFRHSESEYSISHAHHIEFLGGSVHDSGDGSGLRHGIYVASEADDVTIDGVDIYGQQSGFGVHGFASNESPGHRLIVRNCLLHDNGVGDTQAGIVISGFVGAQVYNNVIYGNGGSGIVVSHGGYGSDHVEIYNNTVTGNLGHSGFWGIMIRGGDGHVVRSNISYGNGTGDLLIEGGAAGTAVDHNLVSINPLFHNAQAHDYHLTPNSPAIGMGLTEAVARTDKDGAARGPAGSASDAGAYQFVTTVAPAPEKGTYYIAPGPSGGSDQRTCAEAMSPATPKATLASTLPCAAGESTLYLRQGTYAESLVTRLTPLAAGRSWEAPTTVASYPGETAILQRTTPGAIVELGNPETDHYLVFARLVLDGVGSAGVYGFQVGAGAHHIRFQQGEILRTGYNAVYVAGRATEIVDTLIHDNVAPSALVVLMGTDNLVRGGAIYNGTSSGVLLTGASGALVERATLRSNKAQGLRASGGTANRVVNTLIYSNGGAGLQVEPGERGLTLAHNTFWSNTGAALQILAGAQGTRPTNNIFTANGTDPPSDAGMDTVLTTNVSGDPSFVDPGPPTTFHVDGGNVVHVGTTMPAVTTDFAGKRRSTPPGYTIGAYQDDGRSAPNPQPGRALAFTTSSLFALP